MRIVPAVLLAVLATSCVAADATDASDRPEVATTASALTGTATSIHWIPGETCGGLPICDGTAIWPAGLGITDVQVLLRDAPDRDNHLTQTFLAFVVWNQSVVGRIFRVDVGSDGADFRARMSNIAATRTTNNPAFTFGNSGNSVSGPVPVPHPSVDNELTFNSTYLGHVVDFASVITAQTRSFLLTPETNVVKLPGVQ